MSNDNLNQDKQLHSSTSAQAVPLGQYIPTEKPILPPRADQPTYSTTAR